MNRPVRLAKEDNQGYSFMKSLQGRIEKMVLRHPRFFLALFITLLVILFVAVIFAICGAGTMESSTQYNHLEAII